MIIMPSNNTGASVKELFRKYPDRLSLLLNPSSYRPHQFKYRYAVDNGAYKKFEEEKFFSLLDYSKNCNPPLFIVCPDVVGCHARTLALWNYYYPELKRYDYQIAFVAQNGAGLNDIPKEADWIFVGGLDPWKMENIHNFVGHGRPVHVGRVNGIGRLKYCESIGVTSIDGTGWMQFKDRAYYDLLAWFGDGQQQLELFK